MIKIITILLLTALSFNVFSLPINYIKGSFQSSSLNNKIYFTHNENQIFTQHEYNLVDSWLKQRLNGTKYNYNNLTISYEILGDVRQTVKGCFNSWFKKIDLDTKMNLMEHLNPNGLVVLDPEQIKFISDNIAKYAKDYFKSCKNDNYLGDISTVYISMGLEQYLTDKSNNMSGDKKYNDIFESVFAYQYTNFSENAFKRFQFFMESTQKNFASASSEVILGYIKIINNLNFKILTEIESSFAYIVSLNSNILNLNQYLNDYNKMLPFMKSASLLYEKCFDKGAFLQNVCNVEKIGNNFTIIEFGLGNSVLNNLIWN